MRLALLIVGVIFIIFLTSQVSAISVKELLGLGKSEVEEEKTELIQKNAPAEKR